LTLVKTGTYTDPMAHTRPAVSIVPLVAILATLATTPAGVAHLAAQAQQRAVYVSALDKNGAPVPDLAPADIIVREDDVTREILSIVAATEPMQIAILVDNSQAAEPLIRDYREALPAFVNALTADTEAGSRHEIALIALAERPTILQDYTVEPARVLKAVQRLFSSSGSGTYLLDAILETSQGVVRRGSRRPVMVALVTEGMELSNRHYTQVLEKLSASAAAFHVITVGRPVNMDEDRLMVIDQGPRRSGGSHDTLLLGTALTGRLKRLATELTHQYRVTYARPNRLIPPERVTVTAARPGLTVRGTAVDNTREQSRP
jgi:hypothetical protein